jgi:hypothetical protein
MCFLKLSACLAGMWLATSLWAAGVPQGYPPPAVDAVAAQEYVTSSDGHLQYRGRRLRLWGYNLSAGVFQAYDEIEKLAVRLQQLGVTGVRLWPSPGTFYGKAPEAMRQFVPSSPRDGSKLDRYDFLVAELKRRGIFIQNPALHYLEPSTVLAWNPSFREFLAPDLTEARVRELSRIAPYVSDAFRRMLEAHIRNYLQHVNPYTGNRYAEEEVFSGWELANESSFVPCMLSPRCVVNLPPRLRAAWTSAWEAASAGEGTDGSLPVFDTDWDRSDARRHREYREFVVARFVETSERLRAFARSHARQGIGAAVQPFAFNTQAGMPLAAAHFANSGGDMMAISAYQTPVAKENTAFFPWRPFVSASPILYNFNFGAVENKSIIIYETSFFRPYPYRAEWAGLMLGLAWLQDWDAVYLYMYGQPNAIYSHAGQRQQYGDLPLPEPGGNGMSRPKEVAHGFNHGGDPAIVIPWMAAAAGFRATEAEANSKAPRVFAFGSREIFGPAPGYCSMSCSTSSRNVITAMNEASLRGPVRVSFWKIAEALPERGGPPNEGSPPTSLPRVDFKRQANKVVLQSSHYYAVFGMISENEGVPGVVTVRPAHPFFGAFALSAGDGKPLIESKDLRLFVTGGVSNSGYIFDAAAVRFESPTGAVQGVVNPGHGPLQYEIPELLFDLGDAPATVSRFDFNLNAYRQDVVQGSFSALPAEKFHVARIVREP